MNAQKDTRRAGPIFWGLIAATVACCVLHFAWQMRLPADGCQSDINHLSPEGLVCSDILLEPPHALEINDLVAAVDGQTLEAWLGWRGPRPRWPSGAAVSYSLVRQGQERTVEVTLRPLALGPVLRLGLAYYAFSLAFLLLGSFVFWRRPEDPAARVFLIACLAIALQRCGEVFQIQPIRIVQGWPFWLSLALDQFSWWLILSATLHFALVFPLKKEILARHARPVLGLVYGVFPLVSVTALALRPTLSLGLARLYRADHLSALAGGLVALGLFLHSFRTIRQPLAQAQLRWLAWAACVAVLPTLTFYSLPAILGTRRLLPDEVVLLLFSLIPLAIAFSIVRYRLWDIDVIIRRSLIYGTLTALLTGLYVVLVTALQRLSQALTGQSSPLVLAFSTLIIALLLQPARARVQMLVDRLFFRRRYEARRMLVSFTRDVSRLQSTQAVLDLTLDAVVAAMDIEAASALIRDQDRGEYRLVAARNLDQESERVRFRCGAGVAGRVEREKAPLFLSPAEVKGKGAAALAAGPVREEMTRIQAVVCIPLVAGEQVVALLNLGRKRSQAPYSRDDIDLLTTMGRTAALALENARLHEERLAIVRQQLARVTAVQEEERRRIAQELHDGMGPTLASLNIRLRTAHKLLRRDHHPVAEEVRELAEEVQESIRDLRRLIYDLRPAALDELGLGPALQEYVARYRESQGVDVALRLPASSALASPEDGERLPAALETALFRIVQEALNNVARHAQAQRVEIELNWDEETVRLRIHDDGQGFDPQAVQAGTHVGLWSMEERVQQLGGRFTVQSAPGAGTAIQALIPRRTSGPTFRDQ